MVSSIQALRVLKADGWFVAHQQGSHVKLKHTDKPGRVVVPHPRKDLAIGTIKSIERQSGLKLRP